WRSPGASEAPLANARGDDAEHHAVGGHGLTAPEILEIRVLRVEALHERAALRSVGQELRAALHGHAADLLAAAARLGHDRHARIAAEVADLLRARLADHREDARVVQEPHRHRQRGTIRLHGGEHDDLLAFEESLDARVSEAAHAASFAMSSIASVWSATIVRPVMPESAHAVKLSRMRVTGPTSDISSQNSSGTAAIASSLRFAR